MLSAARRPSLLGRCLVVASPLLDALKRRVESAAISPVIEGGHRMSQLQWRDHPLPLVGDCWEILVNVGHLRALHREDGSWFVQVMMRGLDRQGLFVDSSGATAEQALDDLGRFVPPGSSPARQNRGAPVASSEGTERRVRRPTRPSIQFFGSPEELGHGLKRWGQFCERRSAIYLVDERLRVLAGMNTGLLGKTWRATSKGRHEPQPSATRGHRRASAIGGSVGPARSRRAISRSSRSHSSMAARVPATTGTPASARASAMRESPVRIATRPSDPTRAVSLRASVNRSGGSGRPCRASR